MWIYQKLGLGVLLSLFFSVSTTCAQGGPPFYTNDPGTPGPFNWEINVAYMPFFYSSQSVSHTPDVDINFGIGDRIQLTYENAWLRVQAPGASVKFGLGQANPGVKWRFYDGGENGLSVSVFPQFFVNNPNNAVPRGITPESQSFLLPAEFSRKFGPVDVDYEVGYQFTHKGPDGWIMGLVVGYEFTKKLELDIELYSQGVFHPFGKPTTVAYNPSFMAGRSLESISPTQSRFVGHFGLQFFLPPKSYISD